MGSKSYNENATSREIERQLEDIEKAIDHLQGLRIALETLRISVPYLSMAWPSEWNSLYHLAQQCYQYTGHIWLKDVAKGLEQELAQIRGQLK